MVTPLAESRPWLCLVSPFGTIRVRPVWSAQPRQAVLDHYRSAGLYRDVFIVHACTLRRATRKARLRARRSSF